MASNCESPSARGASGDCGGGAASVGSAAAAPRQLLTLTARFGYVGRHVETVYAASDSCLADLGRLLVRAGGCVSFPPLQYRRGGRSHAPHSKGRPRSGCAGGA